MSICPHLADAIQLWMYALFTRNTCFASPSALGNKQFVFILLGYLAISYLLNVICDARVPPFWRPTLLFPWTGLCKP